MMCKLVMSFAKPIDLQWFVVVWVVGFALGQVAHAARLFDHSPGANFDIHGAAGLELLSVEIAILSCMPESYQPLLFARCSYFFQ
jgi:hypothetical protein